MVGRDPAARAAMEEHRRPRPAPAATLVKDVMAVADVEHAGFVRLDRRIERAQLLGHCSSDPAFGAVRRLISPGAAPTPGDRPSAPPPVTERSDLISRKNAFRPAAISAIAGSADYSRNESALHDGEHGDGFSIRLAPLPRRGRARPGRDAGRHRRRQHHHRRPERRAMGLPPSGAAVPADPDPLYRPGADGAARRGDRQGPRPADPRALRPLLGVVFDRNPDRLLHRRAAERVLRHRRRRRADGRSRAGEPDPGRGGAARHRLHPQLPFGRAHRHFRRRLRAGVPARRLARPSEPQRNRRPASFRSRSATRNTSISPRPTSARSSCRGWCSSSSLRSSRRS